jgi:hypothetical protein
MTHTGALLSLLLALGLMACCCLGAWLFHVGEGLLRRWRQGRIDRARWMKVFLK